MPVRICHLLPHLGGGVGKAMTALVESTESMGFSHKFILFESPIKKQFYDKIIEMGCEIYVTPDDQTTNKLIFEADIVQLEWWSHPATFKFLCERYLPEMRLLVWCHVSGLHFPFIPTKLIQLANKFLFTSKCSFQAENISVLSEKEKARLGVVSSGVGASVDNEPVTERSQEKPCFGYMGSINPSKIHPQFVQYLSAVELDNFNVHVWGDDFYKEALMSQCWEQGKPDLIKFHGYTTNPYEVLKSIDVFIYLLNPLHYGTAENVLLEAMSMGAVPLVMNNSAETAIVEHARTGFVVDGPKEFAETIQCLTERPQERKRVANNASAAIAKHYTSAIMAQDMRIHYNELLTLPKQDIAFNEALGKEPCDWYQACREYLLDDEGKGTEQNDEQFEQTKGSIKHFLDYFPDDLALRNLDAKRISVR